MAIVFTGVNITAESLADNLDYDEAIEMVTDLDELFADVDFSLDLVLAIVSRWERGDFSGNQEELTRIVGTLEDLY